VLTRFDALGSQLTLDKMKRELGIGFRWAAGLAAAAALLTACGEPPIEDPTLTLAHLESPLTLSAQLSIEPADGRFQDEDNAALVALATEAGFLEIEPYPGAGPYKAGVELFFLGPLAVDPDAQAAGLGLALTREARRGLPRQWRRWSAPSDPYDRWDSPSCRRG